MKKHLFFLSMAFGLLLSFSAQAFFPLPPFKEDTGKSAKKTLTTVQTRAQSVAKQIQDSSFVQQGIAYGQGAKEAFEFSQKFVKAVKETDLNSVINLAKGVSNAYAKKKEAKEKAALEIDAKSKANEAKIAELRENNNLLRKEILDNPDKKKKNEKKIRKNEEKINKLTKESKEIADKINGDLASQLQKLDVSISDLKGSANDLIGSFKTIGADYNPMKELKETVSGLMPADDVESSPRLQEIYRQTYLANYYTMLAKVIARSSLLKSQIEEDNKEAQENNEALAMLEGQTPSITTLIKMRAQNSQALLNYTELVLLRLQLDMAYDLTQIKFGRVSVAGTIESFNFDNYRLAIEKSVLDKVKGHKIGGGNVERGFQGDPNDPTRQVIIQAVHDFKRTEEEFKKMGKTEKNDAKTHPINGAR